MSLLTRPAIDNIVSQHLDDAIVLRGSRRIVVRSPHVKLLHLGRLDERLAAHLDGLSISGPNGVAQARAALEVPGVGQIFVATVLAIEARDFSALERLFALIDAVPDAWRALTSAFGWVSAGALRGLTGPLLAHAMPAARRVGIAACALHRVDPGPALDAALGDADTALRKTALRAAGELGRLDLLPPCLAALLDADTAAAAARSAVLLGDREAASDALLARAAIDEEALMLSLFTSDTQTARALVQRLVAGSAPPRTVIRAAGWSGDAQVVPWLFKQMEDDRLARLAGESFSFITGADLAWLDLERKPPQRPVAGPNDDPLDDNVALDEDESLPWPDLARLGSWWKQHRDRFPVGTRYLAGTPPSPAHCLQVLKENSQRQRAAAALMLSLQAPGTAVFNCAAPARRQQRLLDAMAN
jgi:uncharacterized protein (TIGR02270 family)